MYHLDACLVVYSKDRFGEGARHLRIGECRSERLSANAVIRAGDVQGEHDASLNLFGGAGLTRSVRSAAVLGQEGAHLSAVAGNTFQGLREGSVRDVRILAYLVQVLGRIRP